MSGAHQTPFLVKDARGVLHEHQAVDVGSSPICRFVDGEFVRRLGWDSTPRKDAPWGVEIYGKPDRPSLS